MTSTQLRPTRRTLVRGAAWSVPVISVAAAAPAFAASCDVTPLYSMSLSTKRGSDGDRFTRTTLDVSRTAVGITPGSDNLSTSYTGMAGWLMIENLPQTATATDPTTRYQDVTFEFSRSVQNLQFTISDIDTFNGSASNQNGGHEYWDRVAVVNSPNFSGTPVQAGNTAITGSGTTGSPFRQTTFTNDATSPNDSVTRQMRVTFLAPVSNLTLRFWSSRSNGQAGSHAVFIGNMTFQKDCT